MKKAFASDSLIRAEFEKIVQKYGIKIIVETGTYLANTTVFLASIVSKVITIEVKEKYYLESKKILNTIKNVIQFKGNSSEVIKSLKLNRKDPILFFLDAHWYSYNPLLDELKAIANFNFENVIVVIHDFKVPGKNFGYDSYKGQDYEWSWIRKDIENIYGVGNFNYYYNEKTEGANRGIIYITPKG